MVLPSRVVSPIPEVLINGEKIGQFLPQATIKRDVILESAAQNTYVGILSQVSVLTAYAGEIFEGLIKESNKSFERIIKLSQKTNEVAQFVPKIDKYFTTAPIDAILSRPRTEFSLPAVQDSAIFTAESLPQALATTYKTCFPIPNLSKMDPYMEDGKKCQELYTNPNFFLYEWIEEQKKQRAVAREQRIKRREDRKNQKDKEGNKAVVAPKQITLIEKVMFDPNTGEKIVVKRERSAAQSQQQPPQREVSQQPINNRAPPPPMPQMQQQQHHQQEKQHQPIQSSNSGSSNHGAIKNSNSDHSVPPPPMQRSNNNNNNLPPPPPTNLKKSDHMESYSSSLAPPPMEEFNYSQVPPPMDDFPPPPPPEDFNFQATSSYSAPPPPPSSNSVYNSPPIVSRNDISSRSQDEPKSVPNAPPPPPPFIPNAPTPPPQPDMDMSSNSVNSGGMLDEMKKVALKKSETAPAPKKPDARSGLLQGIRGGIALKKVTPVQVEKREDDTAPKSVAAILARRIAIAPEDSDEDSDEENDEWDD